MKRRDKFSSIIPSKLNPIPFVLKIVSVTAKFLTKKIHRKKHLSRVQSTSLSLELREERDSNKYDDKDTIPSNLDWIPLQSSKERYRNYEKATSLDSIPRSSKLGSIPIQSKERGCSTKKAATRRSTSKVVDPIPLDLEIEILSRLPAKSLIKFQCVSKIWSSIIRSQSFVDSFFPMSATRSRFVIAFSNCGRAAMNLEKRLFLFSSSYKGRESSSLATNLDMTIPSEILYSSSDCVSVHGFIWYSVGSSLIVCNPSTGQVTYFPRPMTSLGYDPVDDQFKALTLLPSYPRQRPDFLVHEVSTLGGGRESSGRRNQITTPVYDTVTKSTCINGFVYSGAWAPTRDENPVIVCFDVRFERISFIKAPLAVVTWECQSILIEYKGKLASIARHPYRPFSSFNLWILEDVNKHAWSKQTFELPFSLGMGATMTSPGINKAGEIIFAPKYLSRDVQPFCIFYYNVDRNDIRKVELQGIADDEQYRRRYGLSEECSVHILPEHVERIASF